MADAIKLTRKEKADIIKAEVGKYYKRKNRAVFFELGVQPGGRRRADVVALAMNGHLTIVEVKSCRADLKTDMKWHEYLAHSNQFYLAVTAATWPKVRDLVPRDVGVFVIRQHKDSLGRTYYTVKVVQRAPNRVIDPDIARNMAIRAAFRNADLTKGSRGRRPRRSKRRRK